MPRYYLVTLFVGGEIIFRRLKEQAAKKFAVLHLCSNQNADSDSGANYHKRKLISTQNFLYNQKKGVLIVFFPFNISIFCLNLVLYEDEFYLLDQI